MVVLPQVEVPGPGIAGNCRGQTGDFDGRGGARRARWGGRPGRAAENSDHPTSLSRSTLYHTLRRWFAAAPSPRRRSRAARKTKPGRPARLHAQGRLYSTANRHTMSMVSAAGVLPCTGRRSKRIGRLADSVVEPLPGSTKPACRASGAAAHSGSSAAVATPPETTAAARRRQPPRRRRQAPVEHPAYLPIPLLPLRSPLPTSQAAPSTAQMHELATAAAVLAGGAPDDAGGWARRVSCRQAQHACTKTRVPFASALSWRDIQGPSSALSSPRRCGARCRL